MGRGREDQGAVLLTQPYGVRETNTRAKSKILVANVEIETDNL